MKTLYPLLIIAMFAISINTALPQTGSVELLDGGGVLVSSHASIQEAYNAVPDPILQAYTIEILAAYAGTNEVYPITISVRTGSSAINTVTIRPRAGNTGEVIVGNLNNAIISIDNADYIILDGRPGGTGSIADLTIQNQNSAGLSANTIFFLNGATNNIVRYCNSLNATAGGLGARNIGFGLSAVNTDGNSNNLIENCVINGGRTGVGSSGTAANPNNMNTVRNCDIVDWGYAGIWHQSGTNNMLIENSTIHQTTGVNVTNPSGINISSTGVFNFTIRRNKIYNIKSISTSLSLTIRGIWTLSSPGAGSVINIENNFIALPDNNNNAASTYGILSTGTTNAYTINIYFNSVRIAGTQSGGGVSAILSAGIIKTSTNSGMTYRQKNNISVNNRTGGPAGAKHTGSSIEPSGTMEIDYNSYYADGGVNAYHAMWDSATYNVLANYKAAALPNEQNSIFKNVNFVSLTDLHLSGASILDPELIGTPIAGITTDIDGQTRSAATPYKGADESTSFSSFTLNLTINHEAFSGTDTITVELRSTTAPFDLIESTVALGGGGITRPVQFVNAVNGVSYYIVVKHRNSIETWSKLGGEVFTGGVLNYDFTSSASQAFGSNLVLVGSEYSIYTGDVNQDDVVNLTDIITISNDVTNFVTGPYVVTDLNFDNVVNLTDLLFAYNNSAQFVSTKRP